MGYPCTRAPCPCRATPRTGPRIEWRPTGTGAIESMSTDWIKFECIGKHGTRQYYFNWTQDKVLETFDFTVSSSEMRTPPPKLMEPWFQMRLVHFDEESYRIHFIGNCAGLYRGSGIPCQIIPIAACLMRRAIVSSPKQEVKVPLGDTSPVDRRNDDADKMWHRLQQKKLAEYNPETDRYTHRYTPETCKELATRHPHIQIGLE
jgi:hypothetical protein